MATVTQVIFGKVICYSALRESFNPLWPHREPTKFHSSPSEPGPVWVLKRNQSEPDSGKVTNPGPEARGGTSADLRGAGHPPTLEGREVTAPRAPQVRPRDGSGFLGVLGVPLGCFSGARTSK